VSSYSHLLAQVKSVGNDRTWTSQASSASVDRDDEVVEARAFARAPSGLPPRVPVHDKHFGELVGSGTPYYSGDDLFIDGKFASTPRAEEMYVLAKEGHLTTMSVMFLSLKDKRVEGRRHITAAELVAIDWASISSNREARVLSVRSPRATATVTKDEVMRLLLDGYKTLIEADLAEVKLAEARRGARRVDVNWRAELQDAMRLLREMKSR
jgi:HK97 family phage prohead protease